ncbi:MAG: TolC family protein, partial [Planctomycetota bacterium]
GNAPSPSDREPVVQEVEATLPALIESPGQLVKEETPPRFQRVEPKPFLETPKRELPVATRVIEKSVATDEGTGIDVEQFVAQAVAASPELISIQHRIAALQQRVPQARSLPDPQLQETFWPFKGNALETAGGRAASQIGLTQSVPWPEKLSQKAAIACREIEIARQDYADAKLRIAEEVRLACVAIWLADQQEKLLAETDSLLRDVQDVAEAKYQSGSKQGSLKDVTRAKLESDTLDVQRLQIQKQRSVAEARLAALIPGAQQDASEFSLQGPPVATQQRLDELLGLAIEMNPKLQGMMAEVARDREKAKLACLAKYPDLQLGVNWLIVSDTNALSPVATGNDNFGFTFGMTLPIWRDKIRAGVAEANLQTQASANAWQSERDRIAGQLQERIAEADSMLEYRDILKSRMSPRTRTLLKLTLTDYSGGRADFLSVIEAYREVLKLESKVLSVEASLWTSLIQIQRLVGLP